ncbi:hypothetical protein L1987_84543 [Smallanthus sonchifolius]|uniref:Uncharacterized protein n=1 Tax=Smallanthus sonchifolius TaxID=185202 RepID=A0ACB8YG40_9ASTR|nr:hypothetical protein L1987_84543 [Smallanthus sonchifolius]
MAPEVLRNEQVDEKSDAYSYGVVLWEITTGKIPWENLNSMQVIGAVGFMNQRLEIPNDVDPEWASLIESCWSRRSLQFNFRAPVERDDGLVYIKQDKLCVNVPFSVQIGYCIQNTTSIIKITP